MSKYDIGDYIGAKEAAEIIGISKTYIKHMCSTGKFEGATKIGDRIGDRWVIPRPVVEDYKQRKEERESKQTKTE